MKSPARTGGFSIGPNTPIVSPLGAWRKRLMGEIEKVPNKCQHVQLYLKALHLEWPDVLATPP